MELEYPQKLHERDDDNPLPPEIMTIESEITGEKQHNLRAQYFGASCLYIQILICSFILKMHDVVLGKLLRFHLDCEIILV